MPRLERLLLAKERNKFLGIINTLTNPFVSFSSNAIENFSK
jgi:hypothetical protein